VNHRHSTTRRARIVALAAVGLAALLGACSPAPTDGKTAGTTARITDGWPLDLRYGVTNEVPVYNAPDDITMQEQGALTTVQSGPNAIWNLPKFSDVTVLCQSTATYRFPGSPGGSGQFGPPPMPPRETPLTYFKIDYGKGTGYVVANSVTITERSADTNAIINTSDIKAC
jgi:hypothetical protein